MATRSNQFLLKRSNIINKIPPLSGLTLGEIALNTADAKIFTSYTLGGGSPIGVREIGWDKFPTSGGTISGDTIIIGDIKVNNIKSVSDSDNSLIRFQNTPNSIDIIGDTLNPTYGQILIDSDNTSINIETQYIDFKVPNTGSISINLTNSGYTFPLVDGSPGQVLTTNGGGVLSFASPSNGSGGTITFNEIEIDFGNAPISSKNFNITNSLVTSGSSLIITTSNNVATDRVGNDWEFDLPFFSYKVNNGSFILSVVFNGLVVGKRKIKYSII